jgi:hypothetical protein
MKDPTLMKRLVLLPFAVSVMVLAGCTTPRIPDYPNATPTATEVIRQQSGVEVALDPFVENDRTQKYFDINARDNGIAILHVRLLNKAAEQTFLLQKTNIWLIPTDSGAALAGDRQREASSKAGENNELTAVVLYGVGSEVFGVTFLLAGMAQASHSEEIQRNLISKELPDQSLSPGQSNAGFIFFKPVKKGEDWSRTASVKMTLIETKTQQPVTLTIPLAH